MYVQRLHQFATLKEIAEKLESGLVQSNDLKHFLSQICCEEYPDVHRFEAEQVDLERPFPTYSESTECTGTQTWAISGLDAFQDLFTTTRRQRWSRHCSHRERESVTE